MYKPSDHILIIFGASGDLTRRKLIPALHQLHKLELLPAKFAVLGIGRSGYDDISYQRMISENVEDADALIQMLHYIALDPAKEGTYAILKDKLAEMTGRMGIPANYIFYLATPPSMYETIPLFLAAACLTEEKDGTWKRVIIEKPFGSDYASARSLNETLLKHLQEHQIYRIDHYLGKETVQNVLVTRFSNGIFEPLWNRNFVHHVEITSSESQGVGSRGGYYDNAGALRDMLQNHLLQLVGLVAMEPPTVISSDAIRNEILKVFQSIRPLTGKEIRKQVIRGQYVASHVQGESRSGYREEKGIPAESRTETYVAMKLHIDNWRWGGVPFYIRTGKRLPTRVTEIVVYFNPSPHTLFSERVPGMGQGNQLVIRIQPDEGILLKFGMKVQGAGFKVQEVNMDFYYKDLTNNYIPEAYQRLLLDCMQGDSTLYARGDAVEAAWQFVDHILQAWEKDRNIPLHGYPCGTWGPEIADQMIEGEMYTWRYPSENLADDGLYCKL
jgi:glucose-6-phosphate 1-dehydrogenase